MLEKPFFPGSGKLISGASIASRRTLKFPRGVTLTVSPSWTALLTWPWPPRPEGVYDS